MLNRASPYFLRKLSALRFGNGLHGVVLDRLKEDPCSGALFVFTNLRRNRVKTLYFDGTGMWVAVKRLEQGRFTWPKGVGARGKLELAPEALRTEIRESRYLQIDATHIKYQDPQKDHCPNGYLWAYHSPGRGVLFEWFPSRAAEGLDKMLGGYEGYIQTDGYGAYPSWLNHPKHAREKAGILHAACWAHARRNFVEVPDNSSARKVVKLIAKLYRTETELREQPELDRAVHRRKHSAPVLERIKAILDREQPRQLPQSSFGKAIGYALERWDALNLYLEHATLEIDNNGVENAIRPTAVGKKNFLFFGSPNSGQTSAVIYSLIETCRKLGINPSDYLRDVLEALPTMQQAEAADWTPARWKSSREQTG
jgi:hypothetical protein